LAGKLLTALEQENEAEAIETEARFLEMSQTVIGHMQALEGGEK
jgi:hypothetical protein